jgi:hypothetical protein
MMFYTCFGQQQEEKRGLSPVEFDSSKFTSEGFVPGIIVSVKESPRKLEIEVILEEYHRILKLDTPYARETRRIKNEALKTCEEESKVEFIESYGFITNRAYLFDVIDSVAVEIKPLKTELYEKHLPLFKKLMDADI